MAKSKALNRIKEVLNEQNVSQKELSDFLSSNSSTVYRWCANLTQPSIQDLFRIAKYLNVDVRDLLVPNKLSTAGEHNK